jgi:hypothetical protein
MAKKGTARSAEREAQWRVSVAGQVASGLSVREYCRQQGLREPTFYAWRRTLAQRDAEAAKDEMATDGATTRPAFLHVPLPASSSFALELRGGRTLRLPESLSVERLAAIVRAIEREGTA